MEPSDSTLWTEFTTGSEPAFETLFRRHYGALFQFGSKVCADPVVVEDAIQELFLELWQKKPAVPSLSVKAYLLKATKYKIYKHFRGRKPVSSLSENGEEAFELGHDQFLLREEEAGEKNSALLQALDKLPARQKEIIYLKIYKGLSYEEVSEVMQLNYQVVRNLLCQALKTFRKHCSLLLLFFFSV